MTTDIFVFIYKTDKSKPVKQEVNGTVMVFPAYTFYQIACISVSRIVCARLVIRQVFISQHGLNVNKVNIGIGSFNFPSPSGPYYKNILTIVIDDHNRCLYYKCV